MDAGTLLQNRARIVAELVGRCEKNNPLPFEVEQLVRNTAGEAFDLTVASMAPKPVLDLPKGKDARTELYNAATVFGQVNMGFGQCSFEAVMEAAERLETAAKVFFESTLDNRPG